MVVPEFVNARRAVEQDIDELVDLRAEMFSAMGTPELSHAWRGTAHRWYAQRLNNSSYGFFVVEVEGRVVACAVAAIRDAAPSPATRKVEMFSSAMYALSPPTGDAASVSAYSMRHWRGRVEPVSGGLS